MRFTHGGKCDAAWSGLRIEHGPACHGTFAGTEAGDAHRVAARVDETGSERRRCLSVDEIRAKARKDGEPWFTEERNRYGTRVWSRSRPGRAQNPAWTTGGRVPERLGELAA